ncbi:MAG: deoxyguanosinetriphosphate triphosphohydrolase [Chitinophagales bacterium]
MRPLLREALEEHQRALLGPWGTRADESRGRRFREANDPDLFRTPFQRDRDRVLYSTAFKRLAYKTQVYVVHEGDFYRTRLTHTLEVMQLARSLARVLGANEDLVEAIAYAHDLGHSPFGHAGEVELNQLMHDCGGFDHNLQSLRVVDQLERRYREFPGLNLTFETREGLARHYTAYDHPRLPAEFTGTPQPSLEAQIVNLADQIAFCTHDLDDALQAGLLSLRQLSDNPLIKEALRATGLRRTGGVMSAEERALLHRSAVRNLISRLNRDAIAETARRLEASGVASAAAVRNQPEPLVALPAEVEAAFRQLVARLAAEVYDHWAVLTMAEKGRRIIRDLFLRYVEEPRLLPPPVRAAHQAAASEPERRQIICDHIAGMTDRRAANLHAALFDPAERAFAVAATPF